MFENPGKILKTSAKLIFVFGSVLSFIMFIVYAVKQDSTCFSWLLGIPGSFLSMLILCCIGDHTIAISKIAGITDNTDKPKVLKSTDKPKVIKPTDKIGLSAKDKFKNAVLNNIVENGKII